MTIRSMTAFAQVKGSPASNAQTGPGKDFTLTIKSVNHRFLDLHFRLPQSSESLEMKLRKAIKERLARGHVEIGLNFSPDSSPSVNVNRPIVAAYVRAFRLAAVECKIDAEPNLNTLFRMPGVVDNESRQLTPELEEAVVARVGEALEQLNKMRSWEGDGLAKELRTLMESLSKSAEEVSRLRESIQQVYLEKLKSRLEALLQNQLEPDRLAQEAALLVDRSDIREELARLEHHVAHFLKLLDAGGEVGKKLDFLLQEMNREANTLLSKTSSLSGDALRITELGLAMKSDIEKAREQVQNVE